jgi:hypothetical protein
LVLVLAVSALAGIEALKNRLVSGIGIDSIGVEQYWVLVLVLSEYWHSIEVLILRTVFLFSECILS